MSPICVDIDGTLVSANTLIESTIIAIKTRPMRIFALCAALLKGKAHTKDLIGKYSRQEQISFPYNEALLDWLKAQHAHGRKLILASATDQAIADTISYDLGIFTEVIASTKERSVSASTKHQILKKRFQNRKFAYAGNSPADLSIWNISDSAIIVNATPRVAAAAKKLAFIEAEFSLQESLRVRTVLQEIRIHQWLKNLLLFVPAIAAHTITEPSVLVHAIIGFVAFSFLASATYIFNDILDVPSDRMHPIKKHRPIASGKLSIAQGIVLGTILGTISLALSLLALPASFLGLLALYIIMNLIYTFRAKKVPYLDIGILAGFYVLRIIAGSAATGIETSAWLFFFAGCFFFNLASMKRVTELLQLGKDQENISSRGYGKRDISILRSLGFLCIAFSCIVLALYITNQNVTDLYTRPLLLWLTVPLIVLWASRMWRFTLEKRMPEDPVLFASKDIASYIIAGSMLAVLLIAT